MRGVGPALGAVALASVVLLAGPGVAHADPAGATEWRTEIVSVSPATDLVDVSIVGGDSFVRVEVEPGHELTVFGYAGEPYLRIDTTGDVFANLRSPATYVNASRDGSVDPPATVDPDAEPEWSQVGSGGRWAWHDHRAHWMGNSRPVGMDPGDRLAPQSVPLSVDGVATDVRVVTTLVGSAPWWPAVVGGLVGVLTGVLAFRRRVTSPILLTGVGTAALAIGLAQFMSLPSETGPQLTAWVLPLMALGCGVAASVIMNRGRRLPWVLHGLLLIGGVQLVLWGWQRRAGLTRALLPTDAPYTLDRIVTAAALATGALVAAAELVAVTANSRPADPEGGRGAAPD